MAQRTPGKTRFREPSPENLRAIMERSAGAGTTGRGGGGGGGGGNLSPEAQPRGLRSSIRKTRRDGDDSKTGRHTSFVAGTVSQNFAGDSDDEEAYFLRTHGTHLTVQSEYEYDTVATTAQSPMPRGACVFVLF
jgi:hypothetical protein